MTLWHLYQHKNRKTHVKDKENINAFEIVRLFGVTDITL